MISAIHPGENPSVVDEAKEDIILSSPLSLYRPDPFSVYPFYNLYRTKRTCGYM